MNKRDLDLRRRALSGEGAAAKQLGVDYLLGSKALQRNARVALQYLQPWLEEPDIRIAVAEHAPLEVLIDEDLMWLLRSASRCGSSTAAMKLGIWSSLSTGDAVNWPCVACSPAEGPFTELVERAIGQGLLTSLSDVAERLLDRAPVERLAGMLSILFRLPCSRDLLDRELIKLVRLAAGGLADLSALSAADIGESLARSAERGDTHAQLVLGRAQVGAPNGQLPQSVIVPKKNYREGYARLLRAAHGGEAGAWLELFRASSDYRSVLANQGAAQFFLEQASQQNIRAAQRILGARTLLQARTLLAGAEGQNLLLKAAEAGDAVARALLWSFYPDGAPIQSISAKAVLANISSLNEELGHVFTLAAAFRLSREEAVGLDLSSCVGGRSLIVALAESGSGFVLPALSETALCALRETSAWIRKFGAPAWGPGYKRRRAAAIRSISDALGQDGPRIPLLQERPRVSFRQWIKLNRAAIEGATVLSTDEQ